ncbi:hypothetical protein GTZ99_07585 [Novosphingobium sp. FSY-8]|uniref:Glc operon protein GlcG n=1 Tax=Novosphingobium ovatum TaxID=1908523 RepID=A0ABW9XCZ2_9SPHN|nr:heme-binding protein [Novosphingobium ovatum]NBC36413.1 hypothetical protein [Novosphingobium ovatum]
MQMKRPCAMLGAALLALLGGLTTAGAQVIDQPVLSQQLRLDIAIAAQKACAANGFNVAVMVVDANATPRLLLGGDGLAPIEIESATRKARTAAGMGMPTSALPPIIRQAPEFLEFLKATQPQLILFGGGVPIRIRGQLVGAIGVGGAPRPEADEACITTALTQLAPRLK